MSISPWVYAPLGVLAFVAFGASIVWLSVLASGWGKLTRRFRVAARPPDARMW